MSRLEILDCRFDGRADDYKIGDLVYTRGRLTSGIPFILESISIVWVVLQVTEGPYYAAPMAGDERTGHLYWRQVDRFYKEEKAQDLVRQLMSAVVVHSD